MLRGGGWNNNWNNVRAANRNNNPTNRNNNIGFRCAVSPGRLLVGQVWPFQGRPLSPRVRVPDPFPVGHTDAQPKMNRLRSLW
ncbi:MAG: hypothetical protein GX601_18780 [Anaerolineales bacterium]|nr:hypothetical protein [Anaerolineales bacterium]